MKEPTTLKRFGVSMEDGLLEEFDRLIQRRGYETRSEALRDMVRSVLADEALEEETAQAIATVSLVYDHDVPNLTSKLTEHQHRALDLIASTLHVHLDAHRCLEVLVLRGPMGQVRELADNLISIKGVKYGRFVTTTGAANADGVTHDHGKDSGHNHLGKHRH